MQTVGRFIQQISHQGFQLSPVRLTLFNYLSLFESEDLVTYELLMGFLQDCLDYPHWQQHRGEIAREIENILKELDSNGLVEAGEVQDFLERQIFEIQFDRDFAEAVQSFMTHQLVGESTQFRLIHDGSKRLIAICLHQDGSLDVRQFDRRFTIRHGQLWPIRSDLCLHYTSELELSEKKFHKIEVAPYITARFRIQDQRAYGKIVRGYIFQKLQELRGQSLESNNRLFMAVKRLEQFFVRRESDPYYQRLVSELERLIHLLKIGEPLAPATVMETQVTVQNALEYVFTGDKLLNLLLKDLQNSMDQGRFGHRTAGTELKLPQNLATGGLSSARDADPAMNSEGLEIWQTQKQRVYQNPYDVLKKGRIQAEFASTSTSPMKELPPEDQQTKSLKKVESPSMEKKSTSSELKLIQRPIRSFLTVDR